MTNKIQPPYRMHPDALGALVIFLFSVPGALFSLVLTGLKFRIEWLCDVQLASVCSASNTLECSSVLASRVADPWGVPLTIYSAAAYTVTGVLALFVILRNRDYVRVIRPVLLLLILSMAGVCLGLIVFSLVEFHTLCLFCSALYLVTLVQVMAVGLMHYDGLGRGICNLWTQFGPRRLKVVLLSVTIFVAAVLFQYALYERNALMASQREVGENTCLNRFHKLPDTGLVRSPSGSADVVVAVFLDFACTNCQVAFERFDAILENDEINSWLSVRYYHYPQDPSCINSVPVGRSYTSQRACRAAFAVECVEAMEPGSGYRAASRLYTALKDNRGLTYTDEFLASTLASLVAPEELLLCLSEERPEILKRINHHAAYAWRAGGFQGTPGMLFVSLQSDGSFASTVRRAVGAQSKSTLLAVIESQRSQSHAPADE